jgi:hypothetical protein
VRKEKKDSERERERGEGRREKGGRGGRRGTSLDLYLLFLNFLVFPEPPGLYFSSKKKFTIQ